MSLLLFHFIRDIIVDLVQSICSAKLVGASSASTSEYHNADEVGIVSDEQQSSNDSCSKLKGFESRLEDNIKTFLKAFCSAHKFRSTVDQKGFEKEFLPVIMKSCVFANMHSRSAMISRSSFDVSWWIRETM